MLLKEDHSNYTVTASGYELAEDLEFQWESRINAGNFASQGVATDKYQPYLATAVGDGGDIIEWRLKVTCLNSGQSGYSTTATFEILPSCSGTPDGGVAVVAESSGDSGTTVNFSVSGYSEGILGLSHDWEYSTDEGATWTSTGVSDDDVDFTITGPVGTIFQVRYAVYCNGSEETGYSNVVSFEVTPPTSHCIPTYGVSTGDYLSSVTTDGADGDISYSKSSGPGGHFDETENLILETHPGQEFEINTTYQGGGQTIGIWIDWNEDNVFEGVEERYALNQNNSSANLFSNYLNGQQNVYIYKEGTIAPSTGFVYEDGIWTPENPSGVATQDDNIIVINGETILSGVTTGKDITINAGATLNMEGILNLYGDLTIDGNLVFKSSATGNGELGHVESTSTITGEATVENYMSAYRSYRMVTSAVTAGTIKDNWQEGVNNTSTTNNLDPNEGYGTHITGSTTGANGFDATISGNPSLFTLNVGADPQGWSQVENTDVNTLSVGTPYLLFVRGDRGIDLNSNTSVGSTVLRSTGTLHIGNQTQSFNRSGSDPYFAMFGNPYQSAVDMKQVLNGTNASNVNTEHYYVYDPSIGLNGSYVTVGLNDPVTSVPSSNANEFLQPGQAAQFVTNGGGASSVTFTEDTKAPGNFTNTSAAPISTHQQIRAELYTAEGKLYDGFVMLFDSNFDNAITPSDAQKPMNFRENLGIDHNGTLLSIERRAMPVAEEVYQLYSAGYTTSDYTIKLSLEGLEDSIFYLDDNYTGSSTQLSSETIYSFSVSDDEISKATDRFSIRVETNLGVNDNALSGIRLFPNPLNAETFYIHAPKLNGEQVEINIADMAGRQIFNSTLSCISDKITVNVNDTLASGVYLVTVKFAGEAQTYRLVRE